MLMATSSPRANTSPRSWFLPSPHSQHNPSTEVLCSLLGHEPPPRRTSHPSTASALAPVRPVPAFWHHCSMLGYSEHIVSCGVTWASHSTAKSFRQKEENNHCCWKIFPQIPFLSKTSAYPAWGRASPMDRAGPHAPTCPRQQLSGEEEKEEALSHTNTKAAQDCPSTKMSLGHQPSGGNTTLPFHPLSSLLAWPCSGFLSMPNAVFTLFCQKASWHPVAAPAAPAAVTHKLCPNLKAPACLLRCLRQR